MKIVCIIAGLVFSLFTYWQLNDQSQYGTQLWEGWVLLYGFTALLSFLTAFLKVPRWVYGALAVGSLANAIFRFTAIQWEGRILYNENNPAGNETGGLIVVVAWAGFLWWKARKTGTVCAFG